MKTITEKSCWLVVSILLLIISSGCMEHKTSTTSYIEVVSKQSAPKNKYQIIVVDPNSIEKNKFILDVNSRTTWNLIKENTQYFATYYYYKSLDKGGTLENIQSPSETN